MILNLKFTKGFKVEGLFIKSDINLDNFIFKNTLKLKSIFQKLKKTFN